MLIGCVVHLATDVATDIEFVETAIVFEADAIDVLVATFVKIGILFCVIITEEPCCAACPEIITAGAPLIDFTTENVCVLVPDEFTVTGDRLRLVIGETARNCFTTRILPPDDVVIVPMLFCVNACDVKILLAFIEVGTVSVTILGRNSVFKFSSLLRLTARTFSKLVGTILVEVPSTLLDVATFTADRLFATDT